MTNFKLNDDGSWSEAEPLGYQPGLDVEVYQDGTWEMYDGPHRVAHGRNRSWLGRSVAIWRAKRRYGGAS